MKRTVFIKADLPHGKKELRVYTSVAWFAIKEIAERLPYVTDVSLEKVRSTDKQRKRIDITFMQEARSYDVDAAKAYIKTWVGKSSHYYTGIYE